MGQFGEVLHDQITPHKALKIMARCKLTSDERVVARRAVRAVTLFSGRSFIGGLDVIRKEAWPFYRTISGVRLYWVLEAPQGPKAAIPQVVMMS